MPIVNTDPIQFVYNHTAVWSVSMCVCIDQVKEEDTSL